MAWNQHRSRLTIRSRIWIEKLRKHKRRDSGTSLRSRNRTDGFQSQMVRLFHLSPPPLICARESSHLHVVRLQELLLDARRLDNRAPASPTRRITGSASSLCASKRPPCRRAMSSASPQSSSSPPQTTPKSAASAAASDANIRNFAPVARIMKMALPENAKIAKEAKECMQECVSEFISFITSEGACRTVPM